jgi:propionyl-CoA carboxylase alpha chain
VFKKILIANRGEIACRVMRTAKRMGIGTVAVYSDADRDALHVREADESVRIGPAPSVQSYLVIEAILDAVRQTGADAVHPGYGFLSENPLFAEALERENVAFIGPPAAAVRAMGDKITSKRIAAEAGVSTVPGHMGLVADAAEAAAISGTVGYPVMIKASAGGGGKGMRIAWTESQARDGFEAARREAGSAFGDERIFIEKFVEEPRHIEIQVLGDRHGGIVHLGERECSIQRRNQKVIEEAPSPFLEAETRARMGEEALRLARAVGYFSAGTVEFIVDAARNFYFLEMNTRLQVEHPVTELVTGLDLVEAMIRVAAGERLNLAQGDVRLNGWAVEARVYAEDPFRGFLPSTGRLTRYRPPAEGTDTGDGTLVRIDAGVAEGGEVSVFYDPMIAKLCAWAPDGKAGGTAPARLRAVEAVGRALDGFELEGVGNNLPFLSALMRHARFREGRLTTGFILEEFPDGFRGVEPDENELRRLAAVAAFANRALEERAAATSGTLANHRRRIGPDWVVALGGRAFPVSLEVGGAQTVVSFADGAPALPVSGAWRPGMRLGLFRVGADAMRVKVDADGSPLRLRWQGIDLVARVREPRVAALSLLMPVKAPPDTSRLLLCPMPGVVTALHVAEGEAVEAGQALATIEAMKMENVLRAERQGAVSRIAVQPGQSLAVDQLILEFGA